MSTVNPDDTGFVDGDPFDDGNGDVVRLKPTPKRPDAANWKNPTLAQFQASNGPPVGANTSVANDGPLSNSKRPKTGSFKARAASVSGKGARAYWGIALSKLKAVRALSGGASITRRESGVDTELQDLQIDLRVQEYITLAAVTSDSDTDSKLVCSTPTAKQKQGRKRAPTQVRDILASAATLKNQLLGWENGGGAENGMLQRHQHWSKLRDKGVVDSSDPAVVRWRTLFLVAVISVCCTADPIDATYNAHVNRHGLAMRVFGVALDLLFLFDTLLALRVTKMGLDGTILTDQRRVIRQNTRTPWFAVAVLTSVPYGSIIWATQTAAGGAAGSGGAGVLVLKCLRLTRMLRAFAADRHGSKGGGRRHQFPDGAGGGALLRGLQLLRLPVLPDIEPQRGRWRQRRRQR